MRNLFLVIAVAAIAVTGYFLLAGRETVEVPAPVVTEDSAVEEAEDAAEEAADAAEEAAEEETEAAEEAATEVEEAVEDAVEAATDAVEDVTDSATDAVNDAVDAATEAGEEAVDAATDAAAEAVDTATDGAGLADLLTVDGFDFDQVSDLISGSDLNPLQQTTLSAALEQARDNPELLSQVLDQIKSALGL